jgi:ribosome-interacting GTPase 1
MPANLSPEYVKAEQAFRAAKDQAERLSCLREMLRTIPKHKGTEHLQADIKSRIKQLTEELAGPKKGAARGGPVYVVRKEGAAQIALIGPPNAGKSALHSALTGSRTEVGPYPYSTHAPVPGMAPYEDIAFQLIDLPPVSADFYEPWLTSSLQPADAVMLVVDIADPNCTEDVTAVIEQLDRHKVTLSASWPNAGADPAADSDAAAADRALDPFRLHLPTVLIANKIDSNQRPEDIDVLKELTGIDYPALAVSATQHIGLDAIAMFLFNGLEIVRVYTKAPGKPAESGQPFTLRHGATIHDVALLVHKDFASGLRYARAWGRGVYDGQQVGPEHVVEDGDIVELHMR